MSNQKYFTHLCFFCIVIFLSTLTACQRPAATREYEEIHIPSPLKDRPDLNDPHAFLRNKPVTDSMQDQGPVSGDMQLPPGQNTPEVQRALDASVARPPLVWETPEGWQEIQGSGMRLVTFKAMDKNGTMECSIVSLSGQAGGLESNVTRWMRQINATVSPQETLKDFLSRQESVKSKGGILLKVIDLTELPPADEGERLTIKPPELGHRPSMIAAIAELKDMTVFVKMTGTKDSLAGNREKFTALCASLEVGE